MPPPPTFDARLIEATALSPSVRSLTFARADDAPLGFDAGQWVTLVLPAPTARAAEPNETGLPADLRRSYSIASPPGLPEHGALASRFEIAVTRVEGGPGSTFLHQLPIGATLRVQGPQGFFTRGKGQAKPALFIGTGTGVTPLRSLLHAALRRGDTSPMRLLFGVRTQADLLYKSEFEALAARHPNLQLGFTLSRPEEGWNGRRGYVQHHVPEMWRELMQQSQPAEEPHAYICGLNRMVGSVRELLRGELGAARDQVHSERYD